MVTHKNILRKRTISLAAIDLFSTTTRNTARDLFRRIVIIGSINADEATPVSSGSMRKKREYKFRVTRDPVSADQRCGVIVCSVLVSIVIFSRVVKTFFKIVFRPSSSHAYLFPTVMFEH